jgi:hypothetical protein
LIFGLEARWRRIAVIIHFVIGGNTVICCPEAAVQIQSDLIST